MFKVKINVFRLIIIIIIFSIFNTILKIEANAQSNNIIKNYTTNSDSSINIYKVIAPLFSLIFFIILPFFYI